MAGMSAEARVLGRLAQTIAEAPIHRAATPNARILYRAKAYEYLCVNWSSDPRWLKVLMSNGQQGFIETSRVAVLPYQVNRGRTLGTPTSRGGVASWALNYVGTPYKWGGTDMRNGVDCSAFVQKLYGKIGVDLPRTAAEQAQVGVKIEQLEDLQPGDRLYFWDRRRNKIGHTGIYMGNGYFIHSSRGKRGVDTDYLTPNWRRMLVSARR